MYLKNPADAEDAVHNTFVKLIEKQMVFENELHEKNWLIKVASNISKNMLRHWSRYNADLEEVTGEGVTDEYSEVLDAVSRLPDNLKVPVYLVYYHGYSSKEISDITGEKDSTVRNRLQKARKLLRDVLEEGEGGNGND
jgi:RNA polymerase sigma-70 factor (ECF subfamily)